MLLRQRAADCASEALRLRVISIYNRTLLIDEQLLVALRAHPRIVTREGVYENPHWLPPHLKLSGTLRQQADYWLAQIAPELSLAGGAPATHAVVGADPLWLLRHTAEEAEFSHLDSRDRWKIRCFGRLRIYRNNSAQIGWEVPGGATRKAKTLFAYLLHKGGEGANIEELADLLWPAATDSIHSRNRLYHTVRSLRLALATPRSKEKSHYVVRDGSRYVLVPPNGSWVDISAFEQLCRQSQHHINANAEDEALVCLQAADRLYTGDLFADIPEAYANDAERDWCWSRRYWLRDMFLKVQRDTARVYRSRQDFNSALVHCQKALTIDPVCEIAHEEMLYVLHAQGRVEEIDRQFKLYVSALEHFDGSRPNPALNALRQRLKGKA